jgi:FkbM family methyltransferase
MASERAKSLARAGYGHLARRPAVARRTFSDAIARMAWKYLSRPAGEDADREVWATAWNEIVRRPILVEDELGTKLILWPGHNEQVYAPGAEPYESDEIAFLRSTVQPGMTTFDVGANIGYHTLLLARLVAGGGVVHAFEPEPENFGRLDAHVTLNRLENVVLNQAGACAVQGPVTLHLFPEGFNAWHSLRPLELPNPYNPGATVATEREVTVDGITLDGYCADRGVERIDLLQLDVEGAELEVLEGASGLLDAGAIERVLFEVSVPQLEAHGHPPAEIFERLATAGFTCHPLAPGGGLGEPAAQPTGTWANYAALREG